MKTRRRQSSRSEISDKVKRGQQDMREKERDMEVVARDFETVERTLGSLDFGGTAEGADDVEGIMRRAEQVTEKVFDDKDGRLEQVQSEHESHARELEERSHRAESDLGRVSDARRSVRTRDTGAELSGAEGAIRQDRDFLNERMRTSDQIRAESDRAQEALRSRVRGRGGR